MLHIISSSFRKAVEPQLLSAVHYYLCDQFQMLVNLLAVVPARRVAGWISIAIEVCTTKNNDDTRSVVT